MGVEFARGLCGVSIIRSGESLEAALRDCCKGIKIGKLLVQRHNDSSDVIYEKLPTDIAERHVLLLDPLLSTGHTAVKAIQILKVRLRVRVCALVRLSAASTPHPRAVHALGALHKPRTSTSGTHSLTRPLAGMPSSAL